MEKEDTRPELREGSWERLRDTIYEGHGVAKEAMVSLAEDDHQRAGEFGGSVWPIAHADLL
jgi:hypothetical protein